MMKDPIKVFPLEISSHILHLCFPPPPSFEVMGPFTISDIRFTWFNPDNSVGRIPQQYTLGSVCQKWRQILWSDPTFWNVVFVSVNSRTPPARVVLVKEWLERSTHLPLYLRISTNGRLAWFEKLLRSLLDTIAPHSSRCTLAYLEMPSPLVARLWCDTWKPDALKSLTIRFTDPADVVPRVLDVENTTVGKLSLDNRACKGALVNWECITEFVGGSCMAQKVYEIFSRATGLVKYAVVIQGSAALAPGAPPLVHTSMTSLGLWGSPSWLLDQIRCPNLKSLSCVYCSTDALVSFVTRSECQLTVAEFPFSPHSYNLDVLPFLEVVPTLTTLDIAMSVTETFFKRFTEVNGTPFLPALRTLRVRTTLNFPWSSLLSVVPDRDQQSNDIQQHRHLKIVEIYVEVEDDEDEDEGRGDEDEEEPHSDDEDQTEDITPRLKIAKEDLNLLLGAIRDGVRLTVVDVRTSKDLLAHWKQEWSSSSPKAEVLES